MKCMFKFYDIKIDSVKLNSFENTIESVYMWIGWLIPFNSLLLDKLIQCTCMYLLDTLCPDKLS